jgi:hypothetical protein
MTPVASFTMRVAYPGRSLQTEVPDLGSPWDTKVGNSQVEVESATPNDFALRH